MNSDYDALDFSGFGAMLHVNQIGFSMDVLAGSATRDGYVYDGSGSFRSLLFMTDIYWAAPAVLSVTGRKADGLTYGVGTGFHMGLFDREHDYYSSSDVDSSILELCLGVTGFASYRIYLGEVGARIRYMFMGDIGTILQFTYGLSF